MAIRKNVTLLSEAERKAYVAAVKKLKAAPSPFTPKTAGRYDDYVFVHMQAMLDITINDKSKPVTNDNVTFDPNSMRMPNVGPSVSGIPLLAPRASVPVRARPPGCFARPIAGNSVLGLVCRPVSHGRALD